MKEDVVDEGNVGNNSNSTIEDLEINIYADYEPVDLPGIDFASGKDLIPVSKELVKCEDSLSKFGFFSSYDKDKVLGKVSEMKRLFLEAINSTPDTPLFLDEDEWFAKGSAMEGNLFPALVEISEEDFKEKVLGEEPITESRAILKEALADFKSKSDVRRYIIQLADIDIMVAPNCLKMTEEKWLLRTNFPNYFNIDIKGFQNSDMLKATCENILINQITSDVLCPYKLRDMFEESIRVMCGYNTNSNTALIYSPHGLAFQVVKISLSEGTVMGEFYDIAFAVSCQFWPQCAKEWIDRQRVWPDKDELKLCVDGGVHLVAKSPTNDYDNLAWRLTFAKAEGIISERPLVYWYALRSWSLTKCFLQEFNITNKPNIITSYHIKTLFLYALERLPLDYWINGEYTVKTIVSIIDELLAALAMHECPHYFTPAVNLFENISVEFFSTVAKQLRLERRAILADPLDYFFRGGHEIITATDECED